MPGIVCRVGNADTTNEGDTMRNTVITEIPAAGAELNEAELASVAGGMRDSGRSSKVIDVVDGWTGTDADF
ncbi:hypothetical protein G419_09006 [Rhodococcus triatomae BKS 15-14]|nr:hypothetical protein G419_09006 [Rhodococcus triatomae BKS 15-14]